MKLKFKKSLLDTQKCLVQIWWMWSKETHEYLAYLERQEVNIEPGAP